MLGDGFSILVRSPRADEALAALAGKPWRDLDARIVVMGDAPASALPPGVDVVREIGPGNPRLARFTDHVILLRPDRYVAACIHGG